MMGDRKGIVLAGGLGSRLHPITLSISKQLLPLYDKPMIYYPLSALMLAGIREIAVITTPQDQSQFKTLLSDGSQWGISLNFITQPSPDGLAQAYLLAKEFLQGDPSAMILGDNIFLGHHVSELLENAALNNDRASIFGQKVTDPSRYGVLGFNEKDELVEIVEKPANPPSDYAVTGLYFLDGSASDRAEEIKPSARGELEIVDMLASYMNDGLLDVHLLDQTDNWLDAGTFDSLLDAGNIVRKLIRKEGVSIGCPEEIAFRQGWISDAELAALAQNYRNDYGSYLKKLGSGN